MAGVKRATLISSTRERVRISDSVSKRVVVELDRAETVDLNLLVVAWCSALPGLNATIK